MHEPRWHSELNDHNVVDYAFYVEKRASEIAAAKNYEVVASNVVQIDHLRGNVRKIIGTALLQNARENVIKFRTRHRGECPSK